VRSVSGRDNFRFPRVEAGSGDGDVLSLSVSRFLGDGVLGLLGWRKMGSVGITSRVDG
jgi:hypothetical protein